MKVFCRFRFLLQVFLAFAAMSAYSQKVSLHIDDEAAHFVEGNDSILKYQIADKSSYKGTHTRSNYIHPLYTLDGEVMTEDFALDYDHLHQRGIYWAWRQLYVGDTQLGDAWKIKDFGWDITSVEKIEGEENKGMIRATVFWKSALWTDNEGNEKNVVKETTMISVHPVENGIRLIDFQINLLALEPDMRIGGSENKKGYGGFSQRVRLVDDISFTGPEGVVEPAVTPVKSEGWLNISGSYGTSGTQAGLGILCHPDNPGYPNPWILRYKDSMQNAVYPHPGAVAVPLSETEPTVLRYRLVVYEGDIEASRLDELHTDYAQLPPTD